MATRAANVYRRAELTKRLDAAAGIISTALDVERPEPFPFVRDPDYAANDRLEEIVILMERASEKITEKNNGRQGNRRQASAA